MKKILALSFALAAITFSASAQENTTTPAPTAKSAKHAHRHSGNHKEIMKDITLSGEQKSQMKAIKDDKSLSKQDRKERMSNVLTPDQKTKFAQNKTQMQAKKKEMHEKKEKEMQQKLGLSKAQSAKIKAQNETTHAQMKAIKDDKSLSDAARKEKMKSLKASAHEQRKSVLTADQVKKLDAIKKEGKGKRSKDKQAK